MAVSNLRVLNLCFFLVKLSVGEISVSGVIMGKNIALIIISVIISFCHWDCARKIAKDTLCSTAQWSSYWDCTRSIVHNKVSGDQYCAALLSGRNNCLRTHGPQATREKEGGGITKTKRCIINTNIHGLE